MKFFITGDTHGGIDIKKLNNEALKYHNVSSGDIMWIAGDFGFPWGGRSAQADRYWLDWLEEKDCIFAVIPGNHENYDLLETYPVVDWYGAKAWKLRENIFVIHRGEIVEINGVFFFCMGGGYSIDKPYRTIGINWWEQEMPSKEEYTRARVNLKKVNYRVDYIISHVAPIDGFKLWAMYFHPLADNIGELEVFLQEILENTDFLHWYFAHYHADLILDNRFTLVYNNIKLIE